MLKFNFWIDQVFISSHFTNPATFHATSSPTSRLASQIVPLEYLWTFSHCKCSQHSCWMSSVQNATWILSYAVITAATILQDDPDTTAQELGWYHCCCWPWYDCCCLVTKSCLTLCDPTDYSLSGCSIHGVFQARIVEWVAISFSRGSSQPRNWTPISCFADRFLTTEPPGKPRSQTT